MTISPISELMPQTESTPKATAGGKDPVNKETFLQLLVAQIKNQNPLNPADGAEFLAQLAQFSELEQMMEIRNEIAGLREDTQATEETAGA